MGRAAVTMLADALLTALVAPLCACCDSALSAPSRGAVCAACWEEVAVPGVAFAVTGITAASAAGWYDGRLRDLIHLLKYDGRRSVAPGLAQLMATSGAEVLSNADLVVPVPLHHTRRRERGFNQAADLARSIGVPMRHALVRSRATAPQVTLPAPGRATNLHGAFALAQPWPRSCWVGTSHALTGALRDAVVVLVDDVATTGATLEACAVMLRSAGVREVRALTAARVASAPRR